MVSSLTKYMDAYNNRNIISTGFVKTGLRAVLLLVLLFPVFLLNSCQNQNESLQAVRGILDLRASDSLQEVSVELKGDWAFFWNEFADNSSLNSFTATAAGEFRTVPSYWDPHKRGFAVYSLRILLPEGCSSQLAVKMSNVLENYSLYADGKLLYSAGKPGRSAEESIAESVPALIPLTAGGDYIDLVIQVSNWEDIRGGLSRKIYFGTFENLKSYRERFLAFDALILGAVLIIGIYHLAAFALTHANNPNPPYFFLGIAFLLIALFIGSKDELLFKTLFPDFSADLRSQFIYSTLISSVSFFFCYIFFIFKEVFPRLIFRIVLIISCGAWFLIIFTNRGFYTRLLIPFEIFNITVLFYVAFQLVRHFIRKKEIVIFAFLTGYLLLVLGVVFAMLDNLLIVPPWAPGVIFLSFTFFQTILQAYITSDHIRRISQLNTAFIEMEKETEKLYDLSYIDSLTSLANRRFLNEYMQKLWDRNSITGAQIGMIMIDIDYFKRYNDRYGHLAGDSCLEKVSQRLKELINRRGDLIARYGGEEFVAVFQNCPPVELFRIAERLREGIEQLELVHLDSQCSEFVTISAGVSAAVPLRETTWLSLFKLTDEVLYLAKDRGRNRVEAG